MGMNDEMVENTLVPENNACAGDGNLEPYLGMEFESQEAAKNFYNDYGWRMGFGIRTSLYYRSRKDQTIISRQFVCSKEGFRRTKDASEKKTRQPRLTTREGCKAMLTVRKRESGKWYVAKFEKDHNHPLVSSNEVLCFPSHKRISDPKRKLIDILKEAKIGIGNVLDVLREELDGICNIGFGEDCGNYIGKEKSCPGIEIQGNWQEPTTLRYNSLRLEAIKCAKEGATSADVYRVALCALQEARKKIVDAKANVVTVPQFGSSVTENTHENNIAHECQANSTTNNVNGQDPHVTKIKVCSPANTKCKEPSENPMNRKRTCGNCKVIGHDIRTCPMWKGLDPDFMMGQSDERMPFISGQCSSQVSFQVEDPLSR